MVVWCSQSQTLSLTKEVVSQLQPHLPQYRKKLSQSL
jgi:hypothetical protein